MICGIQKIISHFFFTVEGVCGFNPNKKFDKIAKSLFSPFIIIPMRIGIQ